MKPVRTFTPRASDIEARWRVVDASGKTLGRLATEISSALQGKDTPLYARHINTGQYVVVINAAKVKVTGKKQIQRLYYHHTRYHGGLKAISLGDMLVKRPERVIQHAVGGMLPGSKLGKSMLKRLKVYAKAEHPHQAQLSVSDNQDTKKATQTTTGEA